MELWRVPRGGIYMPLLILVPLNSPTLSEAMPTRLQCLDVPVVDDAACEKAYPGMISRRMMCAGYMDGGRDACNVRDSLPFCSPLFYFFGVELQLFVAAMFSMKCGWPIHKMVFLCCSGWLWQPPGVLWRGPRPGVMGSRMCTAWLPWGLCQGVWVPLLDQRRPQSQPLRKFPVFCSLSISLFHHLSPLRQRLVYFLTGVIDKHTSPNVDNKINTSWYILSLCICLFIFFVKEQQAKKKNSNNKPVVENNI